MLLLFVCNKILLFVVNSIVTFYLAIKIKVLMYKINAKSKSLFLDVSKYVILSATKSRRVKIWWRCTLIPQDYGNTKYQEMH